MEEVKEVKTLKVDYKCPSCDMGFLRPIGNCLPMNPPIYPHQCNNPNCFYGENFNKTYPYITHENI